jgi:hypothetical protein
VTKSARDAARLRQQRRRQRVERRRVRERDRKRRQREARKSASVTRSVTSVAPLGRAISPSDSRSEITDGYQDVPPSVPPRACAWDLCVEPAGSVLAGDLEELNPFCPFHRGQLRMSKPWRTRFRISDAVAVRCSNVFLSGETCGRPAARRGFCWTCYKKTPGELPLELRVSGVPARPMRSGR